MVAFIQVLRILQLVPSKINAGYKLNYTNTNAQDQTGRLLFYQDIYHHNCQEKSYYLKDYTKLIINKVQYKANRNTIDEF